MKSPKVKQSRTKKTDGKDRSIAPVIAEKKQYKSIDEILGFTKSKYKTNVEAEYEKSLARLNTYDLQNECLRVELHPLTERDTMVKRLMKEFRKYTNSLRAPDEGVKPTVDEEKMKRALDIIKARMSVI